MILFMVARPPLGGAGDEGPSLGASSSAPDHPPAFAMDGNPETAWQSDASGEQHLIVDFGAPRELGGLAVAWERDLSAATFTVEGSEDGTSWRTLRRVYGASGETSWIRLPATTTRRLRVRCIEGDGPVFGIREIRILPAAVAASPDSLVRIMAAEARRGLFPRAFGGEPAPWATVGAMAGGDTALLSQDGALGPRGDSFTIEPFLRVGGRTLTWADVKTEALPEKSAAPVPAVRWTSPSVSLDVTALAEGTPGASRILARYRVRNLTAGRLVATLVLAVRPFHARPRAEAGGPAVMVAPIRTLDWDGRRLLVDGRHRIFPLRAPASFNATCFAGGDVASYLEAGRVPAGHEVEDPAGLASGVLTFPTALQAGASGIVVLDVPLSPGAGEIGAAAPDGGEAIFEKRLAAAADRTGGGASR